MKKNELSRKLSYVLSIWAGCLSAIFGVLANLRFSIIFTRSVLMFILFGIIGYIAGWVVHWVMQPRLAFIDDDNEEEEDEDGETMEGV